MVEESLGIEDAIIKGSNNRLTKDIRDSHKPLVLRGVVRRKEINFCIENSRDFYYTDTGYFGNFKSPGNPTGRKMWVRVVKNEMQKTTSESVPADRWKALVKSDPRLAWNGWKTNGRKILLVTPNPKSCNAFDIDFQTWYDKTISTIKMHTDMPIVIRQKGSRSERHNNSIYDALDDNIFATVTFNSIAAIESIAYGIPAFVAVPCAALTLASTDLTKIETPYYPDESKVFKHCHTLAYGQFTSEELLNGTAYNILENFKNEIITK